MGSNVYNKKRTIKIVSIVLAALVLAGLLAGLGVAIWASESYKNELENLHKKSYYEAMDAVGDLELKLDKLSVSQDEKNQQTLLSDIGQDARIVALNLSQLSAKETEMTKVVKFLNQLADYTSYLAKKVETEPLSQTEEQTLKTLSDAVKTLKQSFQNAEGVVYDGKALVGKLGNGIDVLGNCYEQFNNATIDYPQLIYDGPFSDGLSDREAKLLKDQPEKTQAEAEDVIRNFFDGVQKITLLSTTGGSLAGYLFEIVWNGGEGAVTISKRGGHMVEFASYKKIGDPVLSEDEATQKARDVLQKMGIPNMTPVWVENSHSTIYVNFAYEASGIVHYPDLIKVKISADTGDLVGFETTNYLFNHQSDQARGSAPQKTKAEAESKGAKKITVQNVRLALIPTEWNTEILAYEVFGTKEGAQYFIFMDANTLEEKKIMKVIESDGGLLTA